MDVALMINVLHVVDKLPALEEAKRVLHTGGILLVVEWNPAGAALGPAPDKRLSKDQTIALAQQAGFEVVDQFEAGPHHYGIVLKEV